MDKNFNDQELSDIMKEIEALEDNFQTEVGKMEATEAEVMEELAQLDEVEAIPAKVEIPQKQQPAAAKIVPMPAPAPAPASASACKPSATSMSFKVSGDLNLELQFDIEGKVVSLAVNDQGLSITMDGGATFCVPLKKAA